MHTYLFYHLDILPFLFFFLLKCPPKIIYNISISYWMGELLEDLPPPSNPLQYLSLYIANNCMFGKVDLFWFQKKKNNYNIFNFILWLCFPTPKNSRILITISTSLIAITCKYQEKRNRHSKSRWAKHFEHQCSIYHVFVVI